MVDILFAESAWEEYLYWQKIDTKVLKKINELIKSISREGVLEGLGKPEKLKHRPEYSRKIDAKNRLIYCVHDDQIEIVSCLGHHEEY